MVNGVSGNTRYDMQRQSESNSTKNDSLHGETTSDRLLSGSSKMADSLYHDASDGVSNGSSNVDKRSGGGTGIGAPTFGNNLRSSRQELDPAAFLSRSPVSLEALAERAAPKQQVQTKKPPSPLTLPQQREQLQSSVDAFRSGELSADALIDEILAFNVASKNGGVGSKGPLAQLRDNGGVTLSSPERYLPESMKQGSRGEWADRLTINLSRLSPDVLASLVEKHIAEVSDAAPGIVVPPTDKQIALAARILPKLNEEQTAAVSNQLSTVQTLALMPNPTKAQQAALLTETTKLVTLLDKHDALPADWSISKGHARVRYTRDTTPSYLGYSGSSKGDNGHQPVYRSLSSHSAADQQKASAKVITRLSLMGQCKYCKIRCHKHSRCPMVSI